jgi:DNA-binding response OmpR family regulator
MENSFKAGADTYVNKPYDWARLQGHIEKLLGR